MTGKALLVKKPAEPDVALRARGAVLWGERGVRGICSGSLSGVDVEDDNESGQVGPTRSRFHQSYLP